MSGPELLVVDSSAQSAAVCVVCGKDIAAATGVTALFHGRILRFKCPGCLSRFALDPDHYIAGGPSSCCDGEAHAGTGPSAVASEWNM